MSNVRDQPFVTFYTSIYGRIGYLLVAFATGLFTFIFYLPIYIEGIDVLLTKPWWAALAWALVMFLVLWLFIYSLAYAVRLGWRVRCDREKIVFRLLTKNIAINWSDVTSYRFNYAGDAPNVFLIIHTSHENKKHRLDVSGMSPSYQKLGTIISRMVPISRKLRSNGFIGIGDVDIDL